MEKIKNDTMIHILFLKSKVDKGGFKKGLISTSLDDIGITFEQAMDICEELNNHKTIAAWLTSGATQKNVSCTNPDDLKDTK